MFICFVCRKHFENTINISKHFKSVHNFKPFSVYKCVQGNCLQHFSSKYAFIKHLQLHNNDENLNFTSIESPNTIICSLPTLSDTANSYTEHVASETDIFKVISNSALKLSCELYAKENFTRKDAISVQKMVTEFCSNIVLVLSTCIKNPFVEQDKIVDVLQIISNPFQNIETEHKFLQNLKDKDLFEDFHTHNLNNELTQTYHLGQSILKKSNAQCYTFKLKYYFKKIFEITDLLHQTLTNTELLENCSAYSNFASGTLFKLKKSQIGLEKLVIPFFLYCDDFEINNALGSHNSVDTITGVYFSFPTMPKHLLSNLNFIFVAAIVKSKFIKTYGSNSVFNRLIEEIKFLEETGIDISYGGKIFHVHFVLGLVVGDNLGVKSILGFSKSFNCDKYCRHCIRTKSQMKNDCKEHEIFLRNIDNYTRDLDTNDVKLTGICENSIFNDIHTFHVTSNCCVDIMHDLFEGVFRYDICEAILYFLKKKYFTLDFFNMRKQSFEYGEMEIGNISSPLILNHLKKGILKMTASESKTFVHFLPLIIGDKIPKSDQVWKMIILLIKIMDLCLYSSFSEEDLFSLTKNIQKHNKLYIKYFGPLKPKHHFLVHYCTTIKKSGPLKNMWSMRFEAKHKILKKYMTVSSSRRNSALSLMKKISYQFSSFIFKSTLPALLIFNEKNAEFEVTEPIKCFINSMQIDTKQFSYFNKIEFKGTTYKVKHYLASYSDFKKHHLHKIELIIIDNKVNCYLVTSEINIKFFEEHFQSFLIGKNTGNLYFNNIKNFISPPINIHSLSNGNSYIRLKKL